ncbi:MAG: restriction endonuclease [Chloroflexi bacterium]|nr:restriction endonuclease [Chloroflexota bacterium]
MSEQDGQQMDPLGAIEADQQEAAADVPVDAQELLENILRWRDELTDVLEQMPTEAFERLVLRVLGKDGVSDIDVSHVKDTIEGMGVFGGGGFLSFRVSFRCIRGGGRISSAQVDDFRRGVMVGRADKGLLITTGRFTQEAVLKAANERAPEIRLIDGEELVGKLKELSLGVRTEQVVVERVVIERDWFGEI